MSDETGAGELEGFGLEAALSEADIEGRSDLDDVRSDLVAAIGEIGVAPKDEDSADLIPAGCRLSAVPSDRHGHGGIVVSWRLADLVDTDDTAAPKSSDPVDILNEALGPLLFALGFPVEPYAPDGGWIVIGTRALSVQQPAS